MFFQLTWKISYSRYNEVSDTNAITEAQTWWPSSMLITVISFFQYRYMQLNGDDSKFFMRAKNAL